MSKLHRRKKKPSDQRKKASKKKIIKGSCGRKISYSSAKSAHAARRLLEGRGEDGLHVYPCQHCGKHHVGHKP